jgi:hypothetical protein
VFKVGSIYYINTENKIYVNKIGNRKLESCVKINGDKFFAIKMDELRKLGFKFPKPERETNREYFKSTKVEDLPAIVFSEAA